LSTSRREFMHALGVTLASVLITRCRPTCYTPVPPTPPSSEGLWANMREIWYDLDRLARDARTADKGERTRDRLVARHRTALDQLVDREGLDPDVADDLQVAFEAASYHIWRANAPITCYLPSPYPEYRIYSSSDLARQADLLAEMAVRSDIDQATVDQTRSVIERDIAYLAMTSEDQQALIDAVVAAAGDSMDYPGLYDLDLDAPPSVKEAARILVEVLLKEK
jgi:hypothetical protein